MKPKIVRTSTVIKCFLTTKDPSQTYKRGQENTQPVRVLLELT